MPGTQSAQVGNEDGGIVDVLGGGQQCLQQPVPLRVHGGGEHAAHFRVPGEHQSVEVRGHLVGDGGDLREGPADEYGIR